MEEQILREAVRKYGTPLYIFDQREITHVIGEFRRELGERSRICFAVKANPFLVREFAAAADRIEVCSMGEYRICRKLQIPPQKLLISGVLKRPEDIREILSEVGAAAVYTAESQLQFHLLKSWAEENRVQLRVHLRLTAGSQFGMDRTVLEEIIRSEKKNPYIEFIGIHYFSGTQKRNIGKIRKELLMLDDYLAHLKNDLDFAAPELEYGPGLNAAYFENQEETEEKDRRELGSILSGLTWKGTAVLEMGRALAAYCGTYLTKAEDLKRNDGRNYCITDGGLHQLNYDGQIRGMYVPHLQVLKKPEADASGSRTDAGSGEAVNGEAVSGNVSCDRTLNENEGEDHAWTICGSLCTTNDILIQKVGIPFLEAGDVLAFERTGAYSVTEGMALFLSHELPAAVLYNSESGFRLLRPRTETYAFNSPHGPDEIDL